jgi:enamine deaminase RidA (YjgF/YER057c/UK114 family)
MSITMLQPPGWPRPKGYANGTLAEGRQIYVAGQVGWDAQRKFPETLAAQVRQTLENIVAVLKEADARPEHLVRLTWYLTSLEEYRAELPQIGQAYREVIGRHYPAMAAVQVVGLVEPEAKVEIEATAVIPAQAT